MNYDKEKLLKAYMSTPSYAILGLENDIQDLKETIKSTECPEMAEIYKNRVDELQDYLYTIAYLD